MLGQREAAGRAELAAAVGFEHPVARAEQVDAGQRLDGLDHARGVPLVVGLDGHVADGVVLADLRVVTDERPASAMAAAGGQS